MLAVGVTKHSFKILGSISKNSNKKLIKLNNAMYINFKGVFRRFYRGCYFDTQRD